MDISSERPYTPAEISMLPAALSVRQAARVIGRSYNFTRAAVERGEICGRKVGSRWVVARDPLLARYGLQHSILLG